MSFAADAKRELAAITDIKPCCMAAELTALTQVGAALARRGSGGVQITYRTLHPAVAKRILWLLKRRFGVSGSLHLSQNARFGGRRQYVLPLDANSSDALLRLLGMLDEGSGRLRRVWGGMYRRICCSRAYIRGMFLACGSASDPQKGFHAEFAMESPYEARSLHRVLLLNGLRAGLTQRRGAPLLYCKGGEAVVLLFSLMGAARTVLMLENIRAANSLKNAVNRATNCDHANLRKQLQASQQQVQAITAISLAKGLSVLPDALQTLARARLANRDASLEQLGEMLQPPLGKSGVQHRMRRIMQAAEGLPVDKMDQHSGGDQDGEA